MRLLLLTSGLLLLSACGFHLRGTGGYELDVASVYVSAANSYGEFSRELESQITARDIEILDKASAEFAINILSEHRSRRAVATSSDITVSEYELRLETRFELFDALGETVIDNTLLSVERIYRFDRSSLVGAAEEESLLIEEMRRDIAQQLMRRFGATLRKRGLVSTGESERLQGKGPDKKQHLRDFKEVQSGSQPDSQPDSQLDSQPGTG